MPKPSGANVRSIPNRAVIKGRVVRIRVEPDGFGATWNIALQQADDVEGMPNLARDRVGKTIELYTHPHLKVPVVKGDTIEAHVSFRGDERGGRFVIVADDVRKVTL